MIWLAIALGGAFGAVARHALSSAIAARLATTTMFPGGTFSVNLIGCFLAGLLIGATTRAPLSVELRAFLTVGVLGGFTTFSAFGAEVFVLMQNGAPALAFSYLIASLLAAVAAVWAGFALLT
jgi:CrcB protein